MLNLKKIFGDQNEKYLKKIKPIVEKINSLEKEFEKIPDEKLKEKTLEFKERLKKGETLDDILPEAFALVREAAKRTLGQRHYDVQVMGAIALHEGKVVEMKTGEGKTLTATMPLYLNALEGKGCHLVTVNDYLARRDTVWMGQIYHLLGLSVGCLNHEQSFLYDPEYKKPPEEKEKLRDELGSFYVVEDFLRPCKRSEAYLADITYGTNNEFGFDYLRDNMAYDKSQIVQRELHYAIVDEVDFILIDEARTPLIISAPSKEPETIYYFFANLAEKLKRKEDYIIDEKDRTFEWTEKGQEKVVSFLKKDPWAEADFRTIHRIENAIRAKEFFHLDRDYVIKNGQIIIVDEFTGRLMPGRRWSAGIHQAVEAKEYVRGHKEVRVKTESITLATISFQNFFRKYKKLAGMTGTAATSAEEFEKVYGLEVVVIPTNKPMIRKDLPDKIFKTERAKFKAIVEEVKRRYQKGQPILVGTRSIEKNEHLSKLLKRAGIPHQVLNAKHHEKEAQIIAQAGKLKAVTVATNMAGRGVDIILGGNPPDEKEAEKVRELGGLFVLGTERHEAKRIDNQLRGRAGRQGDPGESQFFISLEDELIRIFGGEKIKSLMETLKIPEDQPIESKLVTKAIDEVQAKVEGINFDIRKNLLEYDEVMNKHREFFYKMRREILLADYDALKRNLEEFVKEAGFNVEDLKRKEEEFGKENFFKIGKYYSLSVFDSFWVDYLETMEHLRDSVKLRAYGNLDPLVEYKREGNFLFKKMISEIKKTIGKGILSIHIKPKREERVKIEGKKVGRNDPCPCGSGKKYKKCCWPKYGY
ncbi:MAG TPA: preprotein translocase subunit SecA [bacterium]|nr:preprotein translocase subunit SecA [bacterium]